MIEIHVAANDDAWLDPLPVGNKVRVMKIANKEGNVESIFHQVNGSIGQCQFDLDFRMVLEERLDHWH